jgi:hypothetical protein
MNLKSLVTAAIDLSPAAKRSLAAGSVALSVLLSGCNIVIQAPANLSTLTTPAVAVNIGLPGLYKTGTFAARLNEADITSQFTVNAQGGTAAAGLTLTPGAYMLDVSACWGLNIVFVQAPPWPLNGCSSSRASFAVVQPRLVLGPMGLALAASQSGTATVQAVPAPGSALAIVLSASPASTLTAPSAATMPANSATAVNIQVQGVGPGAGTLSASATGYTSDSLNVLVRPLITQLSPASGPPGTTLAVTGAGFVAPVSVRFGTTAVPVTPASGTALSVSVPQGLVAGATPVSVVSNAQTSAPVTFTVTSPAPMNVAALFRATNDRVEIIQFTLNATFSSSTLQLLGSVSTPLSPGVLSVGLCRDGTRLAWAGAANVQVFGIGGTATAPTLTLAAATPLPSTLTGVGTACVFLPTVLVRGTDLGLDNLNPVTAAKLGGFNGAGSSTGVALAAASPRVWRSHSTGLEEYSMSAPATPSLTANVITNMTGSSTGTALAWLSVGTTLVRATNLGIDVVDVTGAAPSRLGFNNSGGASSTGVGVSVMGTRVVRATNVGVEVYSASAPAAPVRCAFNNTGGASATGVGVATVVLAGSTIAFRATNVGIEAYDISAATTSCPATASGTLIPAGVQLQTGLGTSATGVAVVAR